MLFVLLLQAAMAVPFTDYRVPPGQVQGGEKAANEAYLFAHMIHGDYGKLYYSVSLDGLHWRTLNGTKRVFEEYRGHPDISLGHDGRYYIAGNLGDGAPAITFWVSDDLIRWSRYSEFTPDVKATPGYGQALQRIGAPKVFFDERSRQYVVTWHTPHVQGTKEDPERYWTSQRTLYVTSKDLKSFSSPPKRLFEWEMGTIDVSLRYAEGRYWALLKDERYPTLQWTTGKTIRMTSSAELLGPYAEPGPPISPNFHEAPMLIPSPDGKAWYLYYEQYPGVSYGLSVAGALKGPWFKVSGYTDNPGWNKYEMPAKLRHGCMIVISRKRYDALVEAFGFGEKGGE